MKITSAIWFALGLSWQVQAADENTTVYYWIDAQGVTHFSDRPVAGKTMNSKQVEIINPPASNPNPNPNPIADNTASPPEPTPLPAIAYTLSIASPQSEQTIRDNEGRITVQNQLSPAMPEGEQSQLVLYVDGNRYGCNTANLSCEATNVERGAHQLRTELISQSGKILASSESITVYLFRVTAIK